MITKILQIQIILHIDAKALKQIDFKYIKYMTQLKLKCFYYPKS